MTALNGLNANQLKAVNWDRGPLLVQAGPGSGKTAVLTRRVARLLRAYADDRFRVLGLTFTTKAADEMRERVERLLGSRTGRARMATFHSFCAEVLRQHGSHLGLRPDFDILAREEDRIRVLDEAIRRSDSADLPDVGGAGVVRMIDHLFREGYDGTETSPLPFSGSPKEWMRAVYNTYLDTLVAENQLDYGALLVCCLRLFRERPRIARHYRIVYRYVCVDEYQDTNRCQDLILRNLCPVDGANLFVVADDDQIIYQWNGASPTRLEALRRDYGMEVIQLPESYRCPAAVIELANDLIRFNRDRSPSKLALTAAGSVSCSDPVRVRRFRDQVQEVAWVAADIHERSHPADCTVLARSTKLLESVASGLQSADLKAYLPKRKSDMESAPMRFACAALRLTIGPREIDQLRIMCKAFFDLTGIDVRVERAEAEGDAHGGSLLRGFLEVTPADPRSAKASVVLEALRERLVERLQYVEFVDAVIDWYRASSRHRAADGFEDDAEEEDRDGDSGTHTGDRRLGDCDRAHDSAFQGAAIRPDRYRRHGANRRGRTVTEVMERTGEAAFETVIEAHLLANGYVSVPGDAFDRERAIFPAMALDFIRATQPKEWGRLEALLGAQTGAQLLTDLCAWLDAHGALATLRHGFKCYGRTLYAAFFKAAHDLNPELDARYAANRTGITRQLRFSPHSQQSLDVTLSVNGIPVATLELKNPLTGQTVADARRQYRTDRDPRAPIFAFKRRTLVHFAVDTESVLMTTRLAGDATRFLPFDRGCDGGAGNPPDPKGRGYRTAYLWEEVLQRDSLLDLLARFIHLQVTEKRDDRGRKVKAETMIFPRYHQLEAVRLLVAAARREGVGHNALVEHSAGSGKSNTIAWLTHRLASLHDADDARVFDSVIVVTDRVVLDQQLQDTIYQFEHKRGVVRKIDEDSRQLAEALEDAEPVIITTLQKFPFVSRQLLRMAEERGTDATGVLPTRRCAVIIDEAHSSQGGETATALKEVLGGAQLRAEATARAVSEGLEGEHAQELFLSMAKRGRQPNLSCFAFTATPKHKTLKVFGGRGGAPAHRYPMRQAIEEGFILDVLRHYTTYATYYRLLKECADDPHVERKNAAKALARFLKLHPHNIAQKTEVMVEHFHAVTRHKIGGRAKAMVVTGSRLEAVRFKQSFDRYIARKGYPIKSLVAFSGTVEDDRIAGETYTEERMNAGVREKELPERFASPEYQVLLVAEKYQTGFDQPLLHTMYVDKRLAGIQAVQTLSRLNRTHALKEDTFVLDFVNDRDEIREAFATYYEGAELGAEVDPARMYAIKAEIDASGVYLPEEVERFCAVYFKPRQRQSAADHQAMNAALDPAVSRFAAFLKEDEAEAEGWRGKLHALRNLYGFLSQVIPYQDSDLERLYVYLRHLAAKLPRRRSGPAYDFDDDVRLEYYRLQKISEGSIALGSEDGRALDGPTEVGSGAAHEEEVPLSRLIDIVNERFATDFIEADQLFFDQIVEAAVADDELRQTAAVNPEGKFELVFRSLIDRLFVERMDQNEEIFVRYMNDSPFKQVVSEWLAAQAYRRLRAVQADAAVEADAEPERLRIVAGRPEERYVTCVPLVPLAVAAGAFGNPQTVAAEDDWEWVEIDSARRLRPGMFVAQVAGRSMEPLVPNGAYVLFRAPVEGTRQGKTVLVQLRGAVDPETGARYTLKRYASERIADGDSWRHAKITLHPVNPDFDPIVLTAADEGELTVVAELVEVLTATSLI